MNRKTARLLLVFIALAAAGCRRTSDPNRYDRSTVDLTPVPGGTFIQASIADASYLNPLLASDSASNDINTLVYNGLVKYDENIQLVPELASRWETTNGGRTITFHLRRDVRWHDGKPFTSADVLFTFQKMVDPATRTPYSGDYKLVKRAEAPTPYTFRVHYHEPFAPALESWGMGILPKHIWETGDIHAHAANRHPVGTGPYVFQEWQTDEKIVLAANDDYFLGRPYLDRYVYRIIPDTSVQFLELRQGSLSTMTPTPDQFNGYDEFFLYYDKYRFPAWRYDYIAFNLRNPMFSDVRVRRAIAMAINRDEIIEGVYQGLAVPATGPFPPASWANNPKVKPLPYDPKKARALLAEAGWKDTNGDGILEKNGKPFEFTLSTNQANTVRESIAVITQSALKRIGIRMNVRILEWSVFIHKYIDQRQFEAVLLAWNLARDPDPHTIWHSSQQEKNGYNFVGYSNPRVDRLIEKGRRTFGEEKRAPLYHEVHQLIAEDVPYVFLVHPEALAVVHKKIIGVEEAPAGIGWNFEKWFIPREWQKDSVFAR